MIWHTMGIELWSRNSNPTVATISPRTQKQNSPEYLQVHKLGETADKEYLSKSLPVSFTIENLDHEESLDLNFSRLYPRSVQFGVR